MRNSLFAFLSMVLMLGILAGCSDDTAAPKEEESKAEAKGDLEETEKQDKEEETGKEEAEEDEENGTEAVKEEGEEQKDADKTATPADVAGAVHFKEALDPHNPLPFGTYMEMSAYATEDDTYHTVYVKLDKITSETEDAAYVQKAIEEHNAESTDYSAINKEEMNLPDDIELNVIDFEIVIPEDFPSADYGMPSPNINFTANNPEGGGIPSNNGGSVYLALGIAEEMLGKGAAETDYLPGNSYKQRAYFMMVKGYKDYVLKVNAYPAGSDGKKVEDMHNAYFAAQ